MVSRLVFSDPGIRCAIQIRSKIEQPFRQNLDVCRSRVRYFSRI